MPRVQVSYSNWLGTPAPRNPARIDGGDDRHQFLDVALVLGADKSSDDLVNNLG
jgi:hypothetical protein